MTTTIRTRFAPSPTGYLHIGGVRTALFCWLFARRNQGKFILRIDDTDRRRNVEEALQPILDGLRWLGIDWDEGPDVDGPYAPYYQSQRAPQHQAAAEKLLAAGAAYYDYATTDEIQAEREAAVAEKRSFVYSRRFMDHSPEDRARFEAEGRQAVVRLKMPREGTLVVDDLVRGPVEFEWAREQDHVIQRADGSCLYHLASTVDDHDLQISHVIRAEEHLSNTPRQVFIAQSLGYELPRYAHLPYVAEPGSKTKLSKRKLKKYLKNRDFAKLLEHGQKIAEAIGLKTEPDTFNPLIVDFYKQVGYLPEAIINYLALLGWSLDDKTEHFTRQRLVESFSLERVNKAPASFDPQKLSAFQGRHMALLAVEDKVAMMLPFLERSGLVDLSQGVVEPREHSASPIAAGGRQEAGKHLKRNRQRAEEKLRQLIKVSGDRLKVAGDIVAFVEPIQFVFTCNYDNNSFDKRLIKPPRAKELLSAFKHCLEEIDDFRASTLESCMHRFLEDQGVKIGEIVHALRVATTGSSVGPGIFDCLEYIGKQECIARINFVLHFMDKARPPKPLTPLKDHANPNDPINLHEGTLAISNGEKTLEGDGKITLKWLPSVDIEFQIVPKKSEHFPLGPVTLTMRKGEDLEEDVICNEGFLSNGHYSSSEGDVFTGSTGPIRWGTEETFVSATFQLPNFHNFLGHSIGTMSAMSVHSWAGRAEFSGNGWKVTLDAIEGVKERIDKLNSNRGFMFTHVGKVEREDGSLFTASDLEPVTSALQHFLSFARGFYVAPLLPEGHSSDGRVVWREWNSLRLSDAWRRVHGWFPRFYPDCLAKIFPEFMRLWSDEDSQKTLTQVLYWYLTANTSDRMEVPIMMGPIALELLADISSQDNIANPENRAPFNSVRLRDFLSQQHIPTAIPAPLVNMTKFAKERSLEDGPEVFETVHDVIVHPHRENRAVRDILGRHDALYDVRQLALWYVELALLRLLGYENKYHNRLRLDQLTTGADLVPWVEES